MTGYVIYSFSGMEILLGKDRAMRNKQMKIKLKKYIAQAALVIAALTPAAFLSGCGKEDKEKNTTADQNSAVTTENITDNTSDVPTELTSEEPVSSDRYMAIKTNESAKRLNESSGIYEITDMLPKKEKMYVNDMALTEDGLLVVYVSDGTDMANASFSVSRINTETGGIDEPVENIRLERDASDYHMIDVQIVCTEPLILCDTTSRTFFAPEKGLTGEADIDIMNAFLMAFSAEGQPYFLLDNGNIYRMRLDDTGFTQELVWEAPRLYTNFIPARITGNTILIEATASWEEIPLRVFMSVDLANGTITDSYTFGEEEATGYRCRSCAANIFTYLGDEGEHTFKLRYPDGSGYDLVPTGEDSTSVSLRTGIMYSTFGDHSFYDGGLVFWASEAAYNDRIFFWDISGEKKVQDTEPEHIAHEVIYLTPEMVDEYRNDIESRINIKVIIKDETSPYIEEYTITPLMDDARIYASLMVLDRSYSVFPEGFFDQISGDGMPLRLYICDTLVGNTDSEYTIDSAGGLCGYDADGMYIALSCGSMQIDTSTVFHETGHAIFNKLQEDGYLYEDGYDEWMSLNPPDFEYYQTYRDNEADGLYTPEASGVEQDYTDVYFTRSYSKIAMTEDFADMLGELMGGRNVPWYYKSEHMQAKCRYQFELIRKGFDTDGWPEQLEWEKKLDDFLNE